MVTGSTFSMLQTVMQLSAPSLTTSYSTSFQPFSDLSMITWKIFFKKLCVQIGCFGEFES